MTDDDQIKIPFPKLDIQKDRFKYLGKYKVDTWITSACLVLFLFYSYSVAAQNNFNMDFYNCSAPYQELSGNFKDKATPCVNPFYKPATWKNSEKLPYGEYGLNPKWLNKYMVVVFSIFAGGAILNQVMNIRGKKWE